MAATNGIQGNPLDRRALDLALRSLAIRLEAGKTDPIGLVICGGSALILAGLLPRTTCDVDVVALMREGLLATPDPLPPHLTLAVQEVAEDLNLAHDWLNNGPSRGAGGLFQMGLPGGFRERLHRFDYGDRLSVYTIHRLDQIHFKLYAAVDRGGYHISDLESLDPTPDELHSAARWAMTHDVSEGFAMLLRTLLRRIGHGTVSDRI